MKNHNCVYIELMGGLGNQMFQYAFGRALASRYNADLKLDLQFLKMRPKGYTKRDFRLDVFSTAIKLPSLFERLYYLSINPVVKIGSTIFGRKMVISRFVETPGKKLEFKDETNKHFHFSGYWQNEEYFIHIRGLLLKEFIPKVLSEKAKNYSNAICNCNAVSVHFRRGDYISLKNAFETHGVVPLKYYSDAVQLISRSRRDIVVFVFSDDAKWVKENFKIDQETHFVEGTEDYEDIHLMSLCKHNIIANSSFSWWGAWLNKNPEKIVIAPKLWFAKKDLNEISNTLVPVAWNVL